MKTQCSLEYNNILHINCNLNTTYSSVAFSQTFLIPDSATVVERENVEYPFFLEGHLVHSSDNCTVMLISLNSTPMP